MAKKPCAWRVYNHKHLNTIKLSIKLTPLVWLQCPWNMSVFQTWLTFVWRFPCNFTLDYIALSDKCLTFHYPISHTLWLSVCLHAGKLIEKQKSLKGNSTNVKKTQIGHCIWHNHKGDTAVVCVNTAICQPENKLQNESMILKLIWWCRMLITQSTSYVVTLYTC